MGDKAEEEPNEWTITTEEEVENSPNKSSKKKKKKKKKEPPQQQQEKEEEETKAEPAAKEEDAPAKKSEPPTEEEKAAFRKYGLPDDLFMQVLSWLKPSELCTAAQVNHKWNDVSCSDELWQEFFQSGQHTRGRTKTWALRTVASTKVSSPTSASASPPVPVRTNRSSQPPIPSAALISRQAEKTTGASASSSSYWKQFYKMTWRRKKIAQEIYDSEKSYVQSLRTIVEVFIEPLREKKADAPITTDERKRIFGEIEVIKGYQEELLTDLGTRVNTWSIDQRLGDIFKNMVSFLKVYTSYVNQFDQAILLLGQLLAERESFRALMTYLENKKQCRGLKLNSFLIMPVQRIPRYVLLLQDLVKNTYADHPDCVDLHHALEKMKELAKYIDQKKDEADRIQKLMQIQEQVVNCPTPIVIPGRKFCYNGMLTRMTTKEQAFSSSAPSFTLKKTQTGDFSPTLRRRSKKDKEKDKDKDSSSSSSSPPSSRTISLGSVSELTRSDDAIPFSANSNPTPRKEKGLANLMEPLHGFLFNDVLILAKKTKTMKSQFSLIKRKMNFAKRASTANLFPVATISGSASNERPSLASSLTFSSSASLFSASASLSSRRASEDFSGSSEANGGLGAGLERFVWQETIAITLNCRVLSSKAPNRNTFGFQLVVPNEPTHQFFVNTLEEEQRWLEALRGLIRTVRKTNATAKRRSLILLTPAIKKKVLSNGQGDEEENDEAGNVSPLSAHRDVKAIVDQEELRQRRKSINMGKVIYTEEEELPVAGSSSSSSASPSSWRRARRPTLEKQAMLKSASRGVRRKEQKQEEDQETKKEENGREESSKQETRKEEEKEDDKTKKKASKSTTTKTKKKTKKRGRKRGDSRCKSVEFTQTTTILSEWEI
ncbi:RhoGEF domain containing protein [Balamuthia mandrillaris]